MTLEQGSEHLPTGPNWKKLPPIKDGELCVGCLNCSTAEYVAPMDMYLPVGFGGANVTKDGLCVWDEQDPDGSDWCVQDAEDLAVKDPDHDWRITRYGPMHGETYQRHGPGKWVCIESNKGFA